VLLDHVVAKAEDRLRRKQDRDSSAKTRRANCVCGQARRLQQHRSEGTEISWSRRLGRRLGQAGAQTARPGILPLRGKILNVASATADKLRENRKSRTDPGAGLAARAPTTTEDKLPTSASSS